VENLPFSQACENNKTFILEVLRRHLATPGQVLEIGSGTGQHGVYFAGELPQLSWQATDLATSLADLNRRLRLAGLPNLPDAIELDVAWPEWPIRSAANVFTANTLHIMSEADVLNFFNGVARCLQNRGLLLVYGPFKYGGAFTTDSNERFDAWLKARNPVSGVRDFETVNSYAIASGMELLEDNAMPANNQLLVWQKLGSVDS